MCFLALSFQKISLLSTWRVLLAGARARGDPPRQAARRLRKDICRVGISISLLQHEQKVCEAQLGTPRPRSPSLPQHPSVAPGRQRRHPSGSISHSLWVL